MMRVGSGGVRGLFTLPPVGRGKGGCFFLVVLATTNRQGGGKSLMLVVKPLGSVVGYVCLIPTC